MIHRKIKVPRSHSFFLFGARGTGKTTLLHQRYPPEKTSFIDLLDPEQEERFLKDPKLLSRYVDQLQSCYKRIVIDEIQKVPRLLDVVHQKLEEHTRKGKALQFILTGSSARKLKRGAANLLAGRAFVYYLYPFTYKELDKTFHLETALEYGTLPQIWNLKNSNLRRRYLESYTRTYLKEEVWNEQIIRKIEPFSNFLEIAAQMNGKILNYAKMARDIGVDTKTIQAYFQICEDTLIGFSIPAYHRSIRKRQVMNPKFYFFDTGVKRALERTLTVPLLPQTYAYGEAFEHFVICQMKRQNEYQKKDYHFSYLKTHDGAEVDLVIDRPGKGPAFVEIKSTPRVDPPMVKHLESFTKTMTGVQAYLLSLDPIEQKIGSVQALPWQKGLERLGF